MSKNKHTQEREIGGQGSNQRPQWGEEHRSPLRRSIRDGRRHRTARRPNLQHSRSIVPENHTNDQINPITRSVSTNPAAPGGLLAWRSSLHGFPRTQIGKERREAKKSGQDNQGIVPSTFQQPGRKPGFEGGSDEGGESETDRGVVQNT